MARSRLDSEDLPGELEYILESDDDDDDDEPRRRTFNDSDEFDPAALLSQPLFNDSDGDLNVSKSELIGLAPDGVAVSEESSACSISNMHQQNQSFQQQKQLLQQQQFSGYDQNQNQLQPTLNPMPAFASSGPDRTGSLSPSMSSNQQTINLRVQEVQAQIQQVQDQIQRVQLESSPMMIGQGSQNNMASQQAQGSQNFQVSGMINQSGLDMNRSPPGRSISMPIRRNPMQGSPMNQPTFMMQQPMQQLQQPMQQLQQPMQQLQQQQAMMGGSMDGSMNSGMSNNMNNSVNGNMSNNMNNMQGFAQQPMDNTSGRSVTPNMGMNPNMAMMQQQGMGGMGQIPPAPFVDVGQAVRQNSLPQAGNMGGMVGQPSVDLMSSGGFDPSQMQQAYQPGQMPQDMMPAAKAQGQGGPGVNGAMEKLCESMRRSAMSRSMVKQLSGRSLTRQSSGRVLTKQNSGRVLTKQNSGRLTKQSSGRNLAGANSGRTLSRGNSGRSLQRSSSGRQLLGDGGELPIRRLSQDHKHRIQPIGSSQNNPQGRGMFRHKSQSALMGTSNNKTVLNIDGNTVGMF